MTGFAGLWYDIPVKNKSKKDGENMVGEDAVSVYTQLLMKFIDLLVKIGEEHRRNRMGKEPPKPKIRQGSLSKDDFNKLMKKGVDFKFIPIPKEKEVEVEKCIKDLGGSFFKAADPDNANSLFAVPAHQMEMVQTAVKQTLSNIIKEHPEAIKVKDGDRISPDDMPLVSDVMRRYDIPVYSFKSEDGKYTNIVPTEYEGQYNRAMSAAMQMKDQLDNIEYRTFDMAGTLEKPEIIAKVITENEAADLYAAMRSNGLDSVQFAEYGDDKVMLYYPWQEERIKDIAEKCRQTEKESAEFEITVNDNSISIDKSTLLKGENEREYFVKVPNTHGMDHLILNKNDVSEINGGKSLMTKLEPDKRYSIYDSQGQYVGDREGSELLKLYDVKHKGVNKDTYIAEYGNRIDKIELFNKAQNKLISVGIDNSGRIRDELLEQGISPDTADSLLGRINDILINKEDFAAYRSIFNYTVEKPAVVYADVPNIDDRITQTQLSELVVGKADMIGELPADDGKCCCFYDKNTQKYTLVSPENRSDVVSRLTQMGYNSILAEHLADKAVTGVDPQDIEEKPLHFDSFNSELENITYTVGQDNTILIHDAGENVRYMCIDKGAAVNEIETALFGGFGIRDRMSAAIIMKELSEKELIEPLPTQEIGSFRVTKVSSDMIEVVNKDSFIPEPAMMSIDRINHAKLESIGADEKTIESIERSLKKSEDEFGKPDRLTNLKKFAENTIHKAGQVLEKAGSVLSKSEMSPRGDDR